MWVIQLLSWCLGRMWGRTAGPLAVLGICPQQREQSASTPVPGGSELPLEHCAAGSFSNAWED